MAEQTEQELLERARAGDLIAFADLQALLEAQVRRFIRRLIGSDSEDDIVQEAFFALYMNLEQIDPPAKLRPFLFRVVRNRCYDQLRALGRYEFVSLDEEPEDPDAMPTLAVDQSPQPDEATHWLLLVAQVEQAVESLPELQRQALLLYWKEELSYVEIAEATGASIGTVKSRLHHAKKNLIRLLDPEILQALDVQPEMKS